LGGHFLFTTLGSFGDLHPYIAVAIGLRERGHTVTIASSEIYRAKVKGEGILFHPLRPDLSNLIDDPDVIRGVMHRRTGIEYVIRKLFLPWLEQGFEDTLEAARSADVLAGHMVAFATPTAAEYLRKPWLSIALQPSVFLSAFDPPVMAAAPFLQPLHALGPGFSRSFFRLAKRVVRHWGLPINNLRRRLGLREFRNPIADDLFSPFGTQAWFSKVLAQPQADWPQRTNVTGFPFYDKLEPGMGMPTQLREFLDAGVPPVVFTLGSSAVLDADTFYTESIEAVRNLGCRAVLLVGRDAPNPLAESAPQEQHKICVAEYAPYSELFPRAAATVHQGGVGTTAQALRAGRPMIIAPSANDQPDNANRARRLGIARVVPRGKYRAGRLSAELKALLTDSSYRAAATRVAAEISAEDGVGAACEGLIRML
jgi:UDP:flavonoid glycosyltransferase YjiC (YdhE family)